MDPWIYFSSTHFCIIIFTAQQTVGFVNCPMEYWHWSYGDRYFAYQTYQKYAIYNMVSEKN